jgi:multidrug efflux pump
MIRIAFLAVRPITVISPVYLLALALFCVFLCLAALYESWSIPLAVLLVVPVYFKVGPITVISPTLK